MRTVSGTRNRLLLALAGLLLLAAGAYVVLVSTGASQNVPGLSGLPVGESASVADVMGVGASAFVPVVVAVGVVVAVVCLLWLLAQIPTKPGRETFWLQGSKEAHAVSMESTVLADAIRDECQAVPDVRRATVQVAGSARQPEVFLSMSLEPYASVPRTLERVYGRVLPDVSTALETPLSHVSVEFDVAGAGKASTTKASIPAGATGGAERGRLA